MPIHVTQRTTHPRTDSQPAGSIAGSGSRFTGKRIHFIGIGGCGMSGLARMLLDAGAIVTGSEPKPNPQTFELTRKGAKISRDQIGELIARDVDLVVRTAAVPDTNPEYLVAAKFGLRTIKYAQLLGEVMGERYGIAVAGTHGKSTTSAMISFALAQCAKDPSFVIGGTVPQLGGGSHSGASNLFVAEACEFDRSFHHLHPAVAVITNIEEDHLDCYKNIDEIIESFRKFAQIVPPSGLIIANGQDEHSVGALRDVRAKIERCALVIGYDWSTIPAGIEDGLHVGDVYYRGQKVARVRPGIAGEHNLINATMALAACNACGVDLQQAADALGQFKGVDRRMTEVGKIPTTGALVIDDYGHHPTEIRATLAALRERYSPKRVFCIFQPHQHSRTRFLLEDFATSFAQADETILPDIYFVRDSEAERQKISSADLVDRIKKNGQSARHLPEFSEIARYVRENTNPGDLVVTMGAGNVWEIGRELVS